MSQDYAWKIKKDSTFEEVWNNPYAIEIRQAMLRNEWHPNCNACKEKEEKFGKSGRMEYNSMPFDDFAMLDYRPSNLCNLKCRMCNGFHSSLLAAEESKNQHYMFDKKSSKDLMIDKLDWSKLKRVKLLGGEPMIMEETLDVLDRVSSDCHLMITSNAFVVSKEIEKKLLESKATISINLSIDAVGDNYDYIRVNSKWEKVEDNVKRLKSYGKFRMSVNPVGMIWNAFGLKDLYQWCSDNDVRFGNAHWVGESWNRLGLLSDEHKEEIKHPNINHLLKETFPNREELINSWRDETNRLDLLRGTDIVSVDERYVDYL